MLTCREVTQLVASDAYGEAGLWRRLSVRMHHLMCRHCRRYADQIRMIGDAARSLGAAHPEDPATLMRLSRSILEHLNGNADEGSGSNRRAPDPSG